MASHISGDNAYNQTADFWDLYVKGRPVIPQSFFDFIFEYHADRQGSFEFAHEVGAGVGVHSSRLAARFKHVLVSDVIERNVEIARTRLQGPYSFKASSLEDTIDLPAASVDFIFASTMMHFVEIDAAIKAIHHQLKPGGTFAAGLYGTYALHHAEAQKVWARIVLWITDKIIERFGVNERSKAILQNEGSGLNFVGFPSELFTPAQRYDWNFPTPETQRDMVLNPKYGVEPISRIGPDDIHETGWDRGWFTKQGMKGLKDIATSWPHDENHPEVVSLWKELHDILGDEEVEGAWMVSLVLASKK